MRPRNEHKRSPCCMVRRGRECARSSKVRQKRAFLLFPERMEKQRRVEKYAFELVFCDCLFCEFPEKSGVKLIGKLGPYHLATPASGFGLYPKHPKRGRRFSGRLHILRVSRAEEAGRALLLSLGRLSPFPCASCDFAAFGRKRFPRVSGPLVDVATTKYLHSATSAIIEQKTSPIREFHQKASHENHPERRAVALRRR